MCEHQFGTVPYEDVLALMKRVEELEAGVKKLGAHKRFISSYGFAENQRARELQARKQFARNLIKETE
jgi:hypothetical protein